MYRYKYASIHTLNNIANNTSNDFRTIIQSNNDKDFSARLQNKTSEQ